MNLLTGYIRKDKPLYLELLIGGSEGLEKVVFALGANTPQP